MGLFIQGSGDASANPLVTAYALPGALATGLKALYFMDRGLTLSLQNFAPGGVQGATFNGAPTVNGDGSMTFTGNSIFMQSPLLETNDAAIYGVVSTADPLTETPSYTPWGNIGSDSGRSGNPLTGMFVKQSVATTPPDSKLIAGACNLVSGVVTDQITPALDIPVITTPILLCQEANSSTLATTLFNLTAGTSQTSTPGSATARAPNTVRPFQIGSAPAGGGVGTCKIAVWAYYNVVHTASLQAQFRAWVSNYTNGRHSYSV